MEVVGRHGALGELKVNILGSQVIERAFGIISLTVNVLKETFHMASRVLRASTIKSMGK
jgi:hypothetical protein